MKFKTKLILGAGLALGFCGTLTWAIKYVNEPDFKQQCDETNQLIHDFVTGCEKLPKVEYVGFDEHGEVIYLTKIKKASSYTVKMVNETTAAARTYEFRVADKIPGWYSYFWSTGDEITMSIRANGDHVKTRNGDWTEFHHIVRDKTEVYYEKAYNYLCEKMYSTISKVDTIDSMESIKILAIKRGKMCDEDFNDKGILFGTYEANGKTKEFLTGSKTYQFEEAFINYDGYSIFANFAKCFYNSSFDETDLSIRDQVSTALSDWLLKNDCYEDDMKFMNENNAKSLRTTYYPVVKNNTTAEIKVCSHVTRKYIDQTCPFTCRKNYTISTPYVEGYTTEDYISKLIDGQISNFNVTNSRWAWLGTTDTYNLDVMNKMVNAGTIKLHSEVIPRVTTQAASQTSSQGLQALPLKQNDTEKAKTKEDELQF